MDAENKKIKELQSTLDKTAGEIRILRFVDYLKKVTFFDKNNEGQLIKANFRTDGKSFFISAIFTKFFPRYKGNDHSIEFSVTIDEKTSEFSRDLIALIEKHKDSLSSNERF